MSDNLPLREPSPRHVIIAERTRNIRRLLSRELERHGYSVTALGSAREICSALEHGAHPHVVLLDPDLPDLTDTRLLQRLRKSFQGVRLLVHSFGGQSFPPLADLTIGTIDRNGNVEALSDLLGTYLPVGSR